MRFRLIFSASRNLRRASSRSRPSTVPSAAKICPCTSQLRAIHRHAALNPSYCCPARSHSPPPTGIRPLPSRPPSTTTNLPANAAPPPPKLCRRPRQIRQTAHHNPLARRNLRLRPVQRNRSQQRNPRRNRKGPFLHSHPARQ